MPNLQRVLGEQEGINMARRHTIATSLFLALVVVVCGFVVRVESTAIAIQDVKGGVAKGGAVEKRRLGSFKFLFHYHSQSVTYSEWITLFTLCLAPLVVHLIANVPESSTLPIPSPFHFSLLQTNKNRTISRPRRQPPKSNRLPRPLQPHLRNLALLRHPRHARAQPRLVPGRHGRRKRALLDEREVGE